jgi:Cdc6-like AAA superfamily ATPase
MNEIEKSRLRFRAANVFSPSAPITIESLFAGRRKQLRALLDAVPIRGRHAIVFGEPGVGKTSLARVIAANLPAEAADAVEAPYVSCDSTDTFDSVWRKAIREIKALRTFPGVSLEEKRAFESFPSAGPLTPESVRRSLEYFGRDRTLVIVVDEFDRLPDRGQRRLFAETIKLLSDRTVPATVMIVGVADDVSSLLAEHAFIERALVQVLMPRMSHDELREIIDKAADRVPIKVDPAVVERITRLSQGLPNYTHLLGLEAARHAIDAGSRTIRGTHLTMAIKTAIEHAQATIKDCYYKATRSPHKDNLSGGILLACALAPCDEEGYFAAADVRKRMNGMADERYELATFSRHLHEFCEERRASVLRRTGDKHHFRFRFSHPLLQPFVIMKGIAEGKVGEQAMA